MKIIPINFAISKTGKSVIFYTWRKVSSDEVVSMWPCYPPYRKKILSSLIKESPIKKELIDAPKMVLGR